MKNQKTYFVQLIAGISCFLLSISAGIAQSGEMKKKEWAEWSYKERAPAMSVGIVLGVDYLQADFQVFEPILGAQNVKLLSETHESFLFGMQFGYKRSHVGLRTGFSENDLKSIDNYRRTCRHARHEFNMGYKLLDYKRFNLGPVGTLKWNRYRLLNSDKSERIAIEDHIQNRDLDLRFNQFTGSIGLNLEILLYDSGGLISDHWILGFYGAYLFKLHDLPMMYAKRNRLYGNFPIHIKEPAFGFYFCFKFI